MPLLLTLSNGELLIVGHFLSIVPNFTSPDFPNGSKVLVAPMVSFEVCESPATIAEMLGKPLVRP